MSKLFIYLLRGIIKTALSAQVELLIIIIFLTILYASIRTNRYDIAGFIGINLGFYLIIKGRKKK